jgi:hypothetical protein
MIADDDDSDNDESPDSSAVGEGVQEIVVRKEAFAADTIDWKCRDHSAGHVAASAEEKPARSRRNKDAGK